MILFYSTLFSLYPSFSLIFPFLFLFSSFFLFLDSLPLSLFFLVSLHTCEGGWNNVRMGLECMIVVAHAFGRTLVVPPQQHLYLLGETHKGTYFPRPLQILVTYILFLKHSIE